MLYYRSESSSSSSPTTVPPSYVAAVTNSIAEIIKQAVTEIIKDRENKTRDKPLDMLFGLSVRKQDF